KLSPQPPRQAVFSRSVLLVRLSAPKLKIPPPSPLQMRLLPQAVFPRSVLLVRLSVPALKIPPPLATQLRQLLAVFPLSVLLVMLSVPKLMIPPPSTTSGQGPGGSVQVGVRPRLRVGPLMLTAKAGSRLCTVITRPCCWASMVVEPAVPLIVTSACTSRLCSL